MADIARPRSTGLIGTASASRFGDTISGQSWRVGNSTGADIPETDWTSNAFTVTSIFELSGITGASFVTPIRRRAYTSEAVNSGWELQSRQVTNFSFNVFANNSAASYVLGSTTTPASGMWMLAGRSDGTTRHIFVNGISENSTTTNAVPLTAASGLVGETNSGSLNVYISCIWRRALASAEIYDWYCNPFGLLEQPQARKRYFGAVVTAAASSDIVPLYQQIGLGPTSYGLRV